MKTSAARPNYWIVLSRLRPYCCSFFNCQILTAQPTKAATRQRKYGLHLMVFVALCTTACEAYFLPELDDFGPVLIVDGAITDLPGPYTVKLSLSSGILASDQQAVEGARVTIVEEGGEQETLTESQPGHYTTSANGIQGTPGKSYKVRIQLSDGTPYESEYQRMPSSIGIDSVGADLEYQYLSIDEPDVPGYQFHVTTESAENPESYLMWSLEATYQYRADFTIDYLYSSQGVRPYPNPTEFRTCWRTDQVNEIFTFNTAVLAQPVIEQLPLHFARADEREVSIRYSLLVRQFTLSEEAYTFWNNLQRQIESQETLYNTQPFQIRGNLFNVNDPEETVLGYFMVAGQDEQRVFVDHPSELELTYSYCGPDYRSYGLIGLIHPSNWPIYIYEDEAGDRALANDECFDCRELGGSTTQPAFWED